MKIKEGENAFDNLHEYTKKQSGNKNYSTLITTVIYAQLPHFSLPSAMLTSMEFAGGE